MNNHLRGQQVPETSDPSESVDTAATARAHERSPTIPFWQQRSLWAVGLGVAAFAAWIVGLGAGIRGWILTDGAVGIVAHAQGFGDQAFVWWTPASILTLTAIVTGIGVAVVRHIVDGDVVRHGTDDGEP